MGNISKNFSYHEFTDSETADRHGFSNQITTAEVRDSIKALVDNLLQPLRDCWGEPLHINSGYRCPRLNALVNGAPTSQHVKGEAADVKASSPYELALCALAHNLPFDQMILYQTFVHFSYKKNGPQRHQVLYAKTYRGWKL